MDEKDFEGKSYQQRIKLLVESRGKTFNEFLSSSNDLNIIERKKYFEEVKKVLSQDFKTIIKEYIPMLGHILFSHIDGPNWDSFYGYYSQFDIDKYTYGEDFNEKGATFGWIEQKQNDFNKIIKDIELYLNSPTEILEAPKIENQNETTSFKTYDWADTPEKLLGLYNFLINNNYIEKPNIYKVFEDSFSGKEIDYQPKIKWKKLNQDAGIFVQQLIAKGYMYNCDYHIINVNSQIFINKKNKPISSFKDSVYKYFTLGKIKSIPNVDLIFEHLKKYTK